jgi:hypothetical protein
VNASFAQDFDSHNTTVSVAANYQTDSSFPLGGTPTPLTVMSGAWKGPTAHRHETDLLLGVTQVMTRRWLLSANYSYGSASGPQSDPYRLISVVDTVTGEPVVQRYESRPDSRRKQSLFVDNKVHLQHGVLDLGLRAYQDDWGIQSLTADVRYHLALRQDFYVEPHVRYYSQGAADFFHYYLRNGATLPAYASSDARLAKFNAQTFGAKLGARAADNLELSVRGEYYVQHGQGFPAGAPGQLARQNLMPDLSGFTVLLGATYSF